MEYVIVYELDKPGQDYERLWSTLRSINAKRVMNSVWVLSSEYNAEEIHQKLSPCIDANDKMMIIRTDEIHSSFHDETIFMLKINMLEKKLNQLAKQFNSIA